MKSVFCHFTPQQDNIQVKMFVCKLSKMLSVKAKRSCATLLLAAIMTCVNASQRSIHLDSAGHYNGVVIGFSNDFTADSSNRETMVVSIMEQMQNTSDILRHLIGVQFGEVTIIIPDDWDISGHLQEDSKYTSLDEADILFTDDDKEQILTMQYGLCGEGALPINFPKMYIPDSYTSRLLAHQWILYRYGVFNEYGYVNDFNYPVYYMSADGGVRNSTTNPIINSCSNKPDFNYSSQCKRDISIDPETGRPVNPNCDVVPVENSIQSSFMYAPIAVSEYRLCNGTTHDYLSPNKQNVLCDYQSTFDVIHKHADFDMFKPSPSALKSSPIKFKLWKARKDSDKAHVMYALPSHDSKSLEVSMRTIELLSSAYNFFHHKVLFGLYNDNGFEGTPDWRSSSDIPMVFPENKPIAKLNLTNLINEIFKLFQKNTASALGGTCVLFYPGSISIEDINDGMVERIADQLNKARISLKVIVFDQIPSNNVLNMFDQIISKLTTKSSVDYAFSDGLSTTSSMVYRNQLVSIMNTVLLDMLQHVTEQTHILLHRETVQSTDQNGIKFNMDQSIAYNTVLVEMHTSGLSSELALYTKLTNDVGQVINFASLKVINDKSVMIIFKDLNSGSYKFNFKTSDQNSMITVSVRVLSLKSEHRSYKDAPVTSRCWLNTDVGANTHYPYRGYVQVNKGLNGLVYDADVTLYVRPFAHSQQKQEIVISLHDNGRGNPDISANDGIYSSYLSSIFTDYETGNVAYTVTAKITSPQLAVKPGNFGNTVMFKNKPRCCGSSINTKTDDVKSDNFERVVNCGSFFFSMDKASKRVRDGYAIRDLTLVNIDPQTRILSLKWNSPFISADQSKPPLVKLLYSEVEHSELLLDIKKSFEQSNENDFEILNEDNEDNRIENDMYEMAPELELYTRNVKFESKPEITNSLRQLKIKITNPSEGYYFVVVKERINDQETKLSNIVSVYLKSNVPIENTTALAIDDSLSSESIYSEDLRRGGLTLVHILIICITSALLLFLIILIIICVTIRRHRRANKAANVDYKDTLENGVKKPAPVIEAEKNDSKPTYYDASSLISHSINDKNTAPISNASNNTSCSSVNTVDHPIHYFNQPPNIEPGNRMSNAIGNNNPMVKELNVATLLPNSWDAKELLDHWGRVQEAKQRQESPQAMGNQSTSPSIPSYGGSSLENFNNSHSYMCQPVAVQQVANSHYPGSHAYTPADVGHEYHQPPIYSPYSNASSIWQHQQQQQQQQLQYLHMPHMDVTYPTTGINTAVSYDDHGLPEYSVVRKVHPNISQV